jgi:hypothetical protein
MGLSRLTRCQLFVGHILPLAVARNRYYRLSMSESRATIRERARLNVRAMPASALWRFDALR